MAPPGTGSQKLQSTCHRDQWAVGACGAHLRRCQPCRTTTNQVAAITDFAHTNALAPSLDCARCLALIVPGFSPPTSTAPLHE